MVVFSLTAHLVQLLVFLLIHSSVCEIPEMSTVLGTEQYILLSNQLCSLEGESHVPSGTCPRFFARAMGVQTNTKCDLRDVRVHVMRDPNQEMKPFFLVIGRKSTVTGAKEHGLRSYYAFSKESLEFLYNTENGTLHFIREFNGRKSSVSRYTDFSPVVDTVFDTRYQMLYMFHENRQFEVFHVGIDVDDQKANHASLLKGTTKWNAGDRKNWLEDPYHLMAYYTVRSAHKTELFRFPLENMMSVVLDGLSGTLVDTFSDDRTIFSISKGVMVSRIVSNDTVTTHIRDLYNRNSAEFECEYNEEGKPKDAALLGTSGFTILRDWDLCVLQHGLGNEHCPKDISSEVQTDDSATFAFWILIALLCLTAGFLLCLIIYVVHLRKQYREDMEKVDRALMPYYPTDGACASQMEHMDMSVDRWNY